MWWRLIPDSAVRKARVVSRKRSFQYSIRISESLLDTQEGSVLSLVVLVGRGNGGAPDVKKYRCLGHA